MKADMTNATSLQQVLDSYCANSGQLVSVAKSSVFFSPNTHVILRSEICEALHINTEALSDKYLGLPALVGADRSDCFLHFVERIIQRINGWKEKHLSIGGKEILLKAVAQAIPVYAMSVFQIPKGVCKRMMDAISQFWWGDDANSNKMHWYAWWKLCYPKNEGGMGFRDFHSFNLAMLAKQVWRLIDEPDSLCAKVLRAKYYPHGDILHAGPKAGSSFTWQSIVAGLATFKRGYIWRVGDGDSINIWNDPWIPSSRNRRILSPRGQSIYTKVCELISPISGQWDEEILRSILNPVDVGRVLQIPLNNQGFHDFIAWNFTKNGRFTVRSAYHLQWKHQFGPSAGQLALPGQAVTNPVWKIIWQLKVPAKVKIFIWRSLHGIIPVKCVLANRHIGTSGECPICHQGAEDIRHLLFMCPTAVELWTELGIKYIIDDATSVDRAGSGILEYLFRSSTNSFPGMQIVKLKETIAVACWYLWWIRRRRTHNEDVPPLSKCKVSILAITANAAKINNSRGTMGLDKWLKPMPRYVKVNVDASFHEQSCSGSAGAIIRDYEGKFVAASGIIIPHVSSVAMAEAMAMRAGLELANRLGFNRVIAESDSLETVEACNGSDRWWSESSAILADCVDFASSIGNVTYQFCPREANKVADDIARFCFQNKITCTWDDDPPSFLLNSIVNDVTIL
jgi:ribonuclease HI